MAADGEKIVKHYQRLVNRSHNHRARWERMAPYIAQSRVGILTTPAEGEKQTREVYDSTTLLAAELLAHFVSGHIINPSQRWLDFEMAQTELNRFDSVMEWLEECRDRYLRRVSTSLFYAEGPESLIDWCGFGTGVLFQEERAQPANRIIPGFRGLHFHAERTGRFVLDEGSDGQVDTIMREFTRSARVAQELWGNDSRYSLPESVKTAITGGESDKPFKFIHAVLPRRRAEQGPGNRGMPWASVWIELESKHVVFESGYRIFPAAVFRYHRTPNEVFGRGRGDIAFPDTWTLNTAKRMSLEDWALKIRPPVLHRHDSVFGTLRLVPGAPTAVNTHGASIQDVVKPFETGSRPEVSQINEENLRKSIRDIFYVDAILQLMEVHKSEMTAFEFARRIELLFRLIGPVYGRLEWEGLYQTAEIGFDLMFWAGEFPPPPPEVFQGDGRVNVIFQNPIARAQRAGDAEALLLATNDLAPLGQLDPTIFDWIDKDETAKGVFKSRGFPARWTRDDRQVAALRAARQEQQARELALQEAQQISDAVNKAGAGLSKLTGGGRR